MTRSQSPQRKRRRQPTMVCTICSSSTLRILFFFNLFFLLSKLGQSFRTSSNNNNIVPSRRTRIIQVSAQQQQQQQQLDDKLATIPENSSRSSKSIWETIAATLTGYDNSNRDSNTIGTTSPTSTKEYVQTVTLLRTGIPASILAVGGKIVYPSVALLIASWINDADVFNVIANDYSQYIQNILTTSGLVFALLVGQTYYFMYQQQESTFLALYEEVTMAKLLLEQIALICQGRETLYQRILLCIDRYVQTDLLKFNDKEPAYLIASRPVDDPLEDILYLTSVGEPSIVYSTVKGLRTARAHRLGALQKKLPDIHMTLLWVLFTIVLVTFPLLGAGSQTIGGYQLLQIQSFYFGFIVFAMALVMGVVSELQRPSETGAYNARAILMVMVQGLNDELRDRLNGKISFVVLSTTVGRDEDQYFYNPSIDNDGFFEQDTIFTTSITNTGSSS